MERGGRLHLLVESEEEANSVKIWQLVQTSNTKSENLEHGINEIVAKVQELG